MDSKWQHWVWIQAGWTQGPYSHTTILHIIGKRVKFESHRTGLNQASLLWPWASLTISLNFCFLIGKSRYGHLVSESCYMLVSLLTHLSLPPNCPSHQSVLGKLWLSVGVWFLWWQRFYSASINHAEFSYSWTIFFLESFFITKVMHIHFRKES